MESSVVEETDGVALHLAGHPLGDFRGGQDLPIQTVHTGNRSKGASKPLMADEQHALHIIGRFNMGIRFPFAAVHLGASRYPLVFAPAF